MMKEFNSYNLAKPYSMYRTVYKNLVSHIDCLNDAFEMGRPVGYYASRLYNYTLIFEGYTDCLYDLRLINDIDLNSFYEFCKAIRIECNSLM